MDELLPSEELEEQALAALKSDDKDGFEKALVYATLSVASAIRESVDRLIEDPEDEDEDDDEDQ